MKPIRAALILAALAVLLLATGHPVLALLPALAAAPLVALIIRVVRKRRRQRHARLVDESNSATACGVDGRPVAAAQAAWMRE